MTDSTETATLTLPNGDTISLPVYEPSGGGPKCIDVRSLGSYGYFTYDPGFTSTAACSSKLSYIDGPNGILLHRGYRIEDLAAHCSYLEVCYLLLNGELPSKTQLYDFQSAVSSHMLLHEKLKSFMSGFKDGAHPMAIMVSVIIYNVCVSFIIILTILQCSTYILYNTGGCSRLIISILSFIR